MRLKKRDKVSPNKRYSIKSYVPKKKTPNMHLKNKGPPMDLCK